jgi:leucine-rich repeat-containing G protein-coupled receptor 7
MFINVRKTRQAARISTGDFDFAVRFFFIVLANCICWLPIIILKFAALKKFHISSTNLFFIPTSINVIIISYNSYVDF